MDREKLYRLLRLGIEKGASDIHFQVGYLPLYRFNGDLVELRYKVLTEKDTEAIVKLLLEDDPRGETMDFNEIDLAYELPSEGRFRVNISRQRRTYNVVLRVIPLQIRTFEELNLPNVLRDLAQLRRGYVLDHRCHRHGQVDDPRDDDRGSQPRAEGEDHHDRGSDRVRVHPRQEHHHPARDRHRHRRLPRRAAGRPAPGPGRDHGRRDARPRDRRHLAQGGRDGPHWSSPRSTPATWPPPSTAWSPSSRRRSSSRYASASPTT